MEDKKTTDVELGTLYDLNKGLVNKEKKLSKTVLNKKKDTVISFINKTQNSYYMLLSNERKDYTIFHLTEDNIDKKQELAKILIDECLFNRGDVKGLDITKDNGAIEIWMTIEEDSYVYYFFPYDSALIEI